ncbi:PIN-like domain-containing protein [Pseudomonas sichuanensis]|uniref:PIN-like domain-containing protein n=1 Tax=Pseudomonas sichuanensis TaxID=2213015 RepID=UPI0036EA5910
MKSSFPGHFASEPSGLKRLWEDSLIVMDANVLLSLYRYSDSTRSEFLEVFKKLNDRLWITHQVGKEYLRNRLKVISDQAKTYDAAIQGLNDLRGNFENPKQHPFVSADVLGNCIKSFELIVGELRSNKERHDAKINDDDIKLRLSEIFDGKVGEPYSDERLEEIIVQGSVRYAEGIPPGFKDASKNVGGSLEQRLAPFGDYIVWLQILDKAKSDKRSVIFVTGDNKEDWWLKQSGRTVGPLPELVSEFVNFTDQKFYMYLPDRFLEHAADFLKQEVPTQAVEEVRESRDQESVVAPVPDTEELARLAEAFSKASIKRAMNRLRVGKRLAGEGALEKTVNNSDADSSLYDLINLLRELNRKRIAIEVEISQRSIRGGRLAFSELDDDELVDLLSVVERDRENIEQSINKFATSAREPANQ